MIGRLRGVLIEKTPPTICLYVQGVGYEVDVFMSTFYHLPELEQQVVLYTHLSIRDDANVYNGFAPPQNGQTLRQWTKAAAIGRRQPQAILSAFKFVGSA